MTTNGNPLSPVLAPPDQPWRAAPMQPAPDVEPTGYPTTAEVWSRVTPACATMTILDAAEGRVTADPPRKKVAIIGFSQSSIRLAPYDDPEFEIWGLNQLQPHLPRRVDRHFEIHIPELFTRDMVPGTDYIEWLKTCPVPVYMTALNPGVPNCVRYPLERIVEHFGHKYLTSTPALMGALAIMEGFQHIAFYGIDLVVGPEYERQKACMEFYLGWALKPCASCGDPGVTIELPTTTALLKSRFVYGYEIGPQPGPINFLTVRERIAYLEQRREQAVVRLHGIEGAVAEYGGWILGSGKDVLALTEAQVAIVHERQKKLMEKHDELVTVANQLDGALGEQKGYTLQSMELYDKGVG